MNEGVRDLREAFNMAVNAYWQAAEEPVNIERLTDAADEVLLSRDRLNGLQGDDRDDVDFEVAQVRKHLDSKGVTLCGRPNKTSTGRETYRVLVQPRKF